MVSKQNLGVYPGLVAGGSLLVDYILTVAVSVSAGTDAITSAFPSLHEHKVIIAVVFVLLLTLLNLRGVTESASILAYPVYLFVLALFILIGVGVYNIFTGSVSPDLHVIPVAVKDEVQMALAEEIYRELTSAGIETLLDDRDDRAGVKFKDADLVGAPSRIIVGRGAASGEVEFIGSDGEKVNLPVVEAVRRIREAKL